MNNILNHEQANQLFDREAVLIGSADAVPLYRAAELFGDAAARFADRLTPCGVFSGTFGVGDYQLHFLTKKGFMQAAAFANVEAIRDNRNDRE
jgi:hypothetical protein